MAEDLLDHADVDALLKEKSGRGVPGIVDAGGSDAGFGEEAVPFDPVVS